MLAKMQNSDVTLMQDMPVSWQFSRGESGKHLVVLGSVHGSEPCGSLAIDKMIQQMETDKLNLQAGTVTFIPRANPKAFEAGKRNFESNLGREFVKRPLSECTTYEQRVAQHLIPVLESADYILDLHSFTMPSPPFVFQDMNSSAAENFCADLGAEFTIIGWNDYFSNTTAPASVQAFGNAQGKICATLECGSHYDTQSVDIAFESILKAMRHVGLINKSKTDVSPTNKKYRPFHHFMEDAPGELVQDFKGLQRIAEGEPVLKYFRAGAEEVYYAPKDCHILLPSKNGYKPDQKSADFWCYLIEEVAQKSSTATNKPV